MTIFANFVQKVNFQRSQFKEVGMTFSEVLSFVLGSLRALGKSCFKAPKASLEEYFYHWNIYFCYLSTKHWLSAITVSEGGCGTHWILFICFVFIASIKGAANCFKVQVVFTTDMFIFAFLYKKSTLSNRSSHNFTFFSSFHCGN